MFSAAVISMWRKPSRSASSKNKRMGSVGTFVKSAERKFGWSRTRIGRGMRHSGESQPVPNLVFGYERWAVLQLRQGVNLLQERAERGLPNHQPSLVLKMPPFGGRVIARQRVLHELGFGGD